MIEIIRLFFFIRFVCAQIDVLVKCGAHLTLGPAAIGEILCKAAANGNVNRLKSMLKAGADLTQPDISNRTALHLAVQHGKVVHHSIWPRMRFCFSNRLPFFNRMRASISYWSSRCARTSWMTLVEVRSMWLDCWLSIVKNSVRSSSVLHQLMTNVQMVYPFSTTM